MWAQIAKTIRPKRSSLEETLAAIDSMVAAGRGREALKFAATKWREFQDVRLSDAILRLRRALFVQAQGRPEWPPQIQDKFSAPGIPEIRTAQLNPETVGAGILHHGAVIIRQLVDAEEVLRLRKLIDSAMADAARVRAGEHPLTGSLSYWRCPDSTSDYVNNGRKFTEEGGNALLAGDSPSCIAALIDLYNRKGVIQAIEGYLGERPALSLAKTVLRRVPTTAGTDWHQDGAFLGASIRVVNIWIALSDCGADAPGLDIVGRRIPSVLETGTNGAMFDWSVGPGTVEKLKLDKEVVSPVFKEGDAIMFDQLCLHRTGVRPGMTKTRYAIEAWMFAPSTFPMETFPLVI